MKKNAVTLIIILIAVLLLEIFVFNFNHFRAMLGNFEEQTYKINQEAFHDDSNTYFEIEKIDKEIATLNLEFDESKFEKNAVEYQFEYADETSSGYNVMPSKYYLKGNVLSHFIPTYLSGKVSKIRLCVNTTYGDFLESISINRKIPFHFNVIRYLFVSLLVMTIYVIHTSEFFKQSFKSNNVMQQLVLYGTLILVFMLMFWINNHSTYAEEDNLYNEIFVDSVLQGKFDLDVELGEDFLKLEDPYDSLGRRVTRNGYDYRFDTAYYDGKVYEYFGILPLLLVFLPYKVIFNNYLCVAPVVFMFSAGCMVLLKEILEIIINRYYKDIPFKIVFYLVLTLCFGSLLIYLNGLGRVYELAVVSGLFFTLFGMFFILKSMEKEEKKYRYIFMGALCLALSVACRPTDLFASLVIVPYLISLLISNIKIVKEKKSPLIKLIIGVGIPYIVVGLFTMWYNNVRFGSPFEFGTRYQLTIVNMRALKSRQYVVPMGLLEDFFTIPNFAPIFPYIVNNNSLPVFYGYYYMQSIIAGIFFVAPICFFIFKIISTNKKMENKECKMIIDMLVIVGLLISVLSICMGGSNQRYLVDFLWMFLFAGVMIFLFIYKSFESSESRRIMQKVLCILTIYTIFLGTFSGILSECNYLCFRSPVTYYNLRYTINFWE